MWDYKIRVRSDVLNSNKTGKQDWGRFGVKIGLAYSAYIQGKVVKAVSSIIDAGDKYGVGGYIASGFTDENWLVTARNVELANGGAQVYALGTKLALADVLPKQEANSQFRFDENSAIVKTGYLPSYKEVPLLELGNALIPNTINGKPQVIVPDDVIYMLPMGMYKPVKVVIEGNTVSIAQDPMYVADHTYGMTVTMHIGVDVVVGSKFGAIQLS